MRVRARTGYKVPMAMHTLHAYVDGADLSEVAPLLESEFTRFVASRSWSRLTVFVNERDLPGPGDRPGDLPRWDLGIDHELPDPHTEQAGWFEDVEAIALFLGTLVEKTGRGFIIGITDNRSGIREEMMGVATSNVNLPRLRAALGA